jgi:alpha-glucosidase
VLAVAYKDAELITNSLVYLLAAPSRIDDPSWIKPGKVAWDWWNANNLFGVNFKAGINTQTYKHYIDFAAENGLSYIILDEGWYKLGNLFDVVPEIDVAELVAYGKQKNVGIILWVIWKTLDDQLKPALDQFAQWGVKGIKVDFMQRDDQPIMNYYERVAHEAAQRNLLVDFHGGIRPVLLTRTWPNLITTEGVRGNEWNKWSTHVSPEHDATLPFTRMLLGPMDYTPGATLNASRGGFAYNHFRPSSQGTRCHQLALYVVFESPLQMLADSPSHYEGEPAMMDFLRTVPTEWDETKVLDAKIADYVLVARRRGAEWYVGAITDWSPRELELDLSFLPEGKFHLEIWEDGINASHSPHDFKKSEQSVTRATRLKLLLAEGGGWAARLRAE